MTLSRRIVLAAALVAVGSGHAAAQETTGSILILPFTSAPESSADAELLDQVMDRTAAELGIEAISARASQTDVAMLTGCPPDDIVCYETVAETLGVERVVFGSVESAPGGGLAVSMTVVQPGQEPLRRTATLTSGGRDALQTEFGAHARALLTGAPAPTPAPAPEPTPEPTEPVDLTPPPQPPAATGGGFSLGRVEPYSWAVAGGGVALVGLGSVLLLAAQDKQDEVDSAPTDTVADLEHLADLEDSGKSLTRWGNVALIAGGVATVAGVALIIKQGVSSSDEPPAASVAPTPVAGGVGFTLTVRGDL